MNDPQRWYESPDVGPEIARMLRASQPTRPIPQAEWARSAARVARLATTPAILSTLLAYKGVAFAMLGGVAVGGVAWGVSKAALVGTRPPMPPAVSAVPSPPARPTAPPDTVAPASASAPPLASQPGPAPRDLSIGRQAAALERARSLLGSDPSGALSQLESHAREYPGSKLAIEREYLSIAALRRLGRWSEARRRAQQLRALAPASLYAQRLDEMLGPFPAPSASE